MGKYAHLLAWVLLGVLSANVLGGCIKLIYHLFFHVAGPPPQALRVVTRALFGTTFIVARWGILAGLAFVPWRVSWWRYGLCGVLAIGCAYGITVMVPEDMPVHESLGMIINTGLLLLECASAWCLVWYLRKKALGSSSTFNRQGTATA